MQIALSTTTALEELEYLLILGKNPPFELPAFIFETDFIDLFANMLERMPESSNVVPFMDQFINQIIAESVGGISEILHQNKVDGAGIAELLSGKQLIRIGARKAYNRKVPGKSRKGLGTRPWRMYNNWLLAGIFWKAYVQSHDPAYKVIITEYEEAETPRKAFEDPDFRPLWAMKQAFEQAGKPGHGNANEDIFINPLAEWYLFLKRHGTGGLNGVFRPKRLA